MLIFKGDVDFIYTDTEERSLTTVKVLTLKPRPHGQAPLVNGMNEITMKCIQMKSNYLHVLNVRVKTQVG